MNKFEKVGKHTMRSPGDSKKAHGVKFESEADLEQIFEAALFVFSTLERR